MKTKLVLGVVLLVALLSPGVQAQLAITEVMSLASWEVHPSGTITNNRPDYWELTNFGTNTINLDGYFFSDKRHDNLKDGPFRGLSITGGQTIVFFRVEDPSPTRNTITNEARFRYWWGAGKIPSNTVFKTYTAPGINGSYGDELWIYNRQLEPIDWVFMGEAKLGRSWVSEHDSGYFGALSVPGNDGAVVAEVGEDVGSPGTAVGPFPVLIQEQPQAQTVDAGSDVTFRVRATGLPRPRYQWLWNGLEIPGAISNSYTILDVQTEHAGQFSVRVYNGLETSTSTEAELVVEINPGPPVLVQAPADLTVFPGQTAVFTGRGRGYPAVGYQWQSNGVIIPGATERTLTLPNATNQMSDTLYTMMVWNAYGETNASAVLRVEPKPMLRFTEVMGNPNGGDSSTHYNWFELTNDGTNTVDMLGYRFADSLSFEGAWTITTPLSIRPAESVVFVEHMSPTEFWKWWGRENGLGVQVYTWGGFALGKYQGDIYLWNGAALDRVDWLCWGSWAGSPTVPGISVECMDPTEEGKGWTAMCFTDSTDGWNGAYHSLAGNDLGSPGFVRNPRARIVSMTNSGDGMTLNCRVVPHMSYQLKSTPLLDSTVLTDPSPDHWTDHGIYSSTNYLLIIRDPTANTTGARFYVLEEVN